MEIIEKIFLYLEYLNEANQDLIPDKTNLKEGFLLKSSEEILLKITPKALYLTGNTNIYSKIQSNGECMESPAIQKFISDLGKNIVRINHLGVSYYCSDIDQEIESYKKLLENTSFNLHEEPSGNPNQKWLFVGDVNNWEDPMFEIVLTRKPNKEADKFIPHFQIDLDTTLSFKDIDRIANDTIGGTLNWNYPTHDPVMTMRKILQIENSKVFLSLGTDKRYTKYHRENLNSLS
jgi:hypothetical protein